MEIQKSKVEWKQCTEHYTDIDVAEMAASAKKQGIEIPEDITKFTEFYFYLLEVAWQDGYITRMEGR